MNGTPALALAPAARSHAGVLALRAIGLTVFDIERTERFYRDTLDFRTVARRRLEDSSLNALFGLPAGLVDVLTMQLGDQQVESLGREGAAAVNFGVRNGNEHQRR